MAEHTPPDDRTDAATSNRETSHGPSNRRLRWGVMLVMLAGSMFIIHGIGFIYRTYLTPGFELGVDTLDGVTAAELAVTNPEVASYIAHVHVSFAGLMIATGLGIIALAWYGIRRGDQWAVLVALGMPLVFGVFSIPVHQTVHFEFDFLLHLGPAALGLPVLLAGGMLSILGLRSTQPNPPTTDGTHA